LQTQLTQAKNDSVQLQSQLDQARGEMGKSQANVREVSDQATNLQAQLERAKVDVADAKANADKASGEVAQLRAQLEQASSEAAAAKGMAQKAAGEITMLKAQLQAQPKPAAAETAPVKPPPVGNLKELQKEMPVGVSFRKALVGDGNAVVLQNTSSNSLPVNVRFTDPTATRTKEYRLVLDAGATKELGSFGAWKLASGDKIEIESVNYDTITKTAP